MLFIAFFEWCPGDGTKAIEKTKQMTEERKKGPERFPKLVYGPYNFNNGETKCFAVYETDDPDKLANYAIFYGPEVTVKYIPLIDTRKASELYLKMK